MNNAEYIQTESQRVFFFKSTTYKEIFLRCSSYHAAIYKWGLVLYQGFVIVRLSEQVNRL